MKDRARVKFPLQQDDQGYPPFDSEMMWVIPLNDGGFQVDNIPFFVQMLSYGDVVGATPDISGELVYEKVLRRSGHSTVRLLFESPDNISAAREMLNKLGCSSELSHLPNLIAVDIPAAVSYCGDVRNYLISLFDEGICEIDESCVYDN